MKESDRYRQTSYNPGKGTFTRDLWLLYVSTRVPTTGDVDMVGEILFWDNWAM